METMSIEKRAAGHLSAMSNPLLEAQENYGKCSNSCCRFHESIGINSYRPQCIDSLIIHVNLFRQRTKCKRHFHIWPFALLLFWSNEPVVMQWIGASSRSKCSPRALRILSWSNYVHVRRRGKKRVAVPRNSNFHLSQRRRPFISRFSTSLIHFNFRFFFIFGASRKPGNIFVSCTRQQSTQSRPGGH